MKRPVALSLAISFAAVFAVSLSAKNDANLAGTWKLDTSKSKFGNGAAPKNATRKIESQGEGETTTCEEVEADDSQITYSYTATYDGKDSPITGSGRPTWREDLFSGADTISIRRTGSNSFGVAFKKSGQVVMTVRSVVSKDGKTLTMTANGADAKGQPTSSVMVWDKQ
jgi:hypothetical protein